MDFQIIVKLRLTTRAHGISCGTFQHNEGFSGDSLAFQHHMAVSTTSSSGLSRPTLRGELAIQLASEDSTTDSYLPTCHVSSGLAKFFPKTDLGPPVWMQQRYFEVSHACSQAKMCSPTVNFDLNGLLPSIVPHKCDRGRGEATKQR